MPDLSRTVEVSRTQRLSQCCRYTDVGGGDSFSFHIGKHNAVALLGLSLESGADSLPSEACTSW